jgi:hypothetical protein
MSAWIVWPTFSSSVILASRPSTKASVAGSTRPWLLATGHLAAWAVAWGEVWAIAAPDRKVDANRATQRVLVFILPNFFWFAGTVWFADSRRARDNVVITPVASASGQATSSTP